MTRMCDSAVPWFTSSVGVAKTPSLRRPHSTRWAPERGACVDVAVEVIEETLRVFLMGLWMSSGWLVRGLAGSHGPVCYLSLRSG